MSSSLNSWQPPPDELLKFDDCEAAAKWFSSILYRAKDGEQGKAFLPPVDLLEAYLRSMIPTDYKPPSTPELLNWWWQNVTESDYIRDRMSDFAIGDCPAEICKAMDWPGDSDLAGVGMVIAYFMAASLSTLYFLVLATTNLSYFKKKTSHKARESLRSTLTAFVDSSLIFSLAMVCATVYRHCSSITSPEKTNSIYGLVNGTFMSLFAVLPTVMLQTVAEPMRRKRVRMTLWFCLICLNVASGALYYDLIFRRVEDLMSSTASTTEGMWLLNCNYEDGMYHILALIIAGQAVILFNIFWWIYSAVEPAAFFGRLTSRFHAHPKLHRLGGRVIVVMRRLNGIVCFALMWAYLIVWTLYRQKVIQTMSSKNADGQWTLGQVLALATWAPVVIELVSAYMYGSLEALEQKLPQNFHVVEAPERRDTQESLGFDQQNFPSGKEAYDTPGSNSGYSYNSATNGSEGQAYSNTVGGDQGPVYTYFMDTQGQVQNVARGPEQSPHSFGPR